MRVSIAALLADVRCGFRALIASPAYVALAVLCLGIGIGTNTMTLTVIDSVLLQPLRSVDAERLVRIAEVHRTAPNLESLTSSPDFFDWQTAAAGFAEMGALRASSFAFGASEPGERIDGAFVTANYFSVLGVEPILGQGFGAEDVAGGSKPVVVLSESYWRRRYGSDRTIVGRSVRIDGRPHTVIGVLPGLLDAGMPREIRAARIWLPLRVGAERASRDDRSLSVVARLAAGVGIEAASVRFKAIAIESTAIYPENAGRSLRVRPFENPAIEGRRSTMLLLTGAVAVVLLVASANAANLMLASAARRRHEVAIRSALGATRRRFVRQRLTESLAVSAAGALLGLTIARSGRDLLLRSAVAANDGPGFALPIDVGVLVCTVGLALVSTALFGLFPAMRAARLRSNLSLPN